MKSLIRLSSIIIVVSITATSCVSNYVISNKGYKYPTTSELLVYHPKSAKGPNVSGVNEKKLISEKDLLAEKSKIHAEMELSKKAYDLLGEAKTYLGTPYRYGGTTRNGIDCSSFVQKVFASFNIRLPRTSASQSQKGFRISKENLKKGDLIFFAHTPKSRISHVGIVENVSPSGEVFFIHASSSQGVVITSLDTAYWRSRFRTGKRILNAEDFQIFQEEMLEKEAENLIDVSF
ncbi:MAG: C40 family peptidase [Flavobacteriaceae bacterium]|jgi:lipoprotein Spr|nr:C40 family peptidase [Flavobacteriaceae bacterium]